MHIFDFAHLQRLDQHLGVDFHIDGGEHRFTDRTTNNNRTMAAHQRHGAIAKRLGEVAAHVHVGDEQIGVIAKLVADIPVRNIRADRRAHMHDRAHFAACHGEGHNVRAVIMHDAHHIGARFQNGAMDEAFRIRLANFFADNRAIELEFHNVAFDRAGRSACARHQKMVRIARMANGNMAEGIDNMMMGENMVRRDELFLQLTQIGHHYFLRCLRQS